MIRMVSLSVKQLYFVRPACAAALLFIIYCQVPIDAPDALSSYSEIESVWQYLKAYSIYQDRIPPDPFVFSSSTALLLSINDTLGGNYYTWYRSDTLSGIQPSSQLAAALAGLPASAVLAPRPNSAVLFDSLTGSTALITIWTFDDDFVYDDFLYYESMASRFSNIVINIRNDRGGYINQADSIIAALVPAGTAYVEARERDYDTDRKIFVTIDWHTWATRYGPRPLFQGKHFAVLMNGYSASASEIVAAALYEGDTTTRLIGPHSYGKGIGQVEIVRRRDMRYEAPYLIRKKLIVTYLQLRGVSSRIGNYHLKGIQPDTIPPAYVLQAAGLPSEWQRQVFYAVKMLDTTATPSSINYPPERDTLGLHKTAAAGCSKVINEE
jgi:hypothetical protein